jgi:hypothetical protein
MFLAAYRQVSLPKQFERLNSDSVELHRVTFGGTLVFIYIE